MQHNMDFNRVDLVKHNYVRILLTITKDLGKNLDKGLQTDVILLKHLTKLIIIELCNNNKLIIAIVSTVAIMIVTICIID